MRKIFPIVLLIVPYFLLAGIIWPEFAAWFNTMVNGMWIEVALAIAIGVWAISLYIVQSSYWPEQFCAGWHLALKLGHLPFQVCMILILLGSPMYMFLLFWPISMAVTATGLYGIRTIGLARQRDAVNKYFALVHMIACYIPVFDALSALIVFFTLRKVKSEVKAA